MSLHFSICSYNILADAYINPEWYQHVPPSILDPNNRTQSIAQTLLQIDTDIICLQEVEAKRFASLQKMLSVHYVGVLSGKGKEKKIDV